MLARSGNDIDTFVAGGSAEDLVYAQQADRVVFAYGKPGQRQLLGNAGHIARVPSWAVRLCFPSRFVVIAFCQPRSGAHRRPGQSFRRDRFQQIVDGVVFEGGQGIFRISGHMPR